MTSAKRNNSVNLLPKAPTGIPGMDEITGGGLPLGSSTLVADGAGCGKTLFAMEFLVNGATQDDEWHSARLKGWDVFQPTAQGRRVANYAA